MFIAKYSNSGNLIWAQAYGDGQSSSWGNYYGNSIYNMTGDGQGNLYIGGRFKDTIVLANTMLSSTGGDDLFIAKYDTAGNAKWAISGGSMANENMTVSADPSGHVYVGGTSSSPTLNLGSNMVSNQSTGDVFVGKLTYYTLGVDVVHATSSITVYPNPSTGSFYFSGVKEGSVIAVYDVMGSVLTPALSKGEGGTAVIDLSGRGAGVYFYRVMEHGAMVQQGKLVVE